MQSWPQRHRSSWRTEKMQLSSPGCLLSPSPPQSWTLLVPTISPLHPASSAQMITNHPALSSSILSISFILLTLISGFLSILLTLGLSCLVFFLCLLSVAFSFFFFFRPHLQHMEVPRLGVGCIRAAAPSLRHSPSNARSEPHL